MIFPTASVGNPIPRCALFFVGACWSSAVLGCSVFLCVGDLVPGVVVEFVVFVNSVCCVVFRHMPLRKQVAYLLKACMLHRVGLVIL